MKEQEQKEQLINFINYSEEKYLIPSLMLVFVGLKGRKEIAYLGERKRSQNIYRTKQREGYKLMDVCIMI
jgi:hypothetical protein